MVGKLTDASAQTLLRPWRDQWQVWTRKKKETTWEMSPVDSLQTYQTPAQATTAIPASLVVTVPFWVEAVEEATVRSVAQLEVEMKGLVSSERSASDVQLDSLKEEGGRTLVRAVVYPADWPAELASLNTDSYVPSPMLGVLTGNTVHLWREFDDLVAVVVWQDQIICWETMHWPAEQKEIEAWLRCLLLQLRSELKITERFTLREWVSVFQGTPLDFAADSGLTEAERAEGPALVPPARPGGWMPAQVREQRKASRDREFLIRGAIVLGSVFLAVILGAVLLRWGAAHRVAAMDREIARLDEMAAPSRRTAERWNQIESAVDDRFYPIEMLHAVVGALPPQGVRLTDFEMSPERILVEGEAVNVTSAADYFRALQNALENSSGITWEMTPPTLQANNTAHFVINGIRNNGQ